MDKFMIDPIEFIIGLYFVNISANEIVIIVTSTIIVMNTKFFISLNLLY